MNKGTALSTAEPKGASRWALRLHSLLIYLFFYAPIAVLVVFSFNDAQLVGDWKGFSLDWYEAFFDNENIQESIWISVKVCILSLIHI